MLGDDMTYGQRDRRTHELLLWAKRFGLTATQDHRTGFFALDLKGVPYSVHPSGQHVMSAIDRLERQISDQAARLRLSWGAR